MVYRSLLFALDPETAHGLAIAAVRTIGDSSVLQAPVRRLLGYAHPCLSQQLMGLNFANPLGLAAGFDKNATALGGWASLGFGYAEVGSITCHAQDGNPAPRLFRLPQDHAIINRMGFNNIGAAAVAASLQSRTQQIHIPVGINLGKSKITPLAAAAQDYGVSFKLLQELGDYFVINVSSPNTPGLRDLQAVHSLEEIICTLQKLNINQKPLLIKIAPDLNDRDIAEIVKMSLANSLAGIIATNTTIARPNLQSSPSLTQQSGGLSGQPLKERSLSVIKLIHQLAGQKLVVIGVGGIASVEDAWDRIRAGAALLQIYTGLVYGGFSLVKEINQGLVKKLDSAGFSHISEAVGSGI